MADDAKVDPRQTIEVLLRELDARTAERDEALAQQAAISEVLQIINSSPGDLAPVFYAMLEKAVRLCEAAFGTLSKIDGDEFCGIAWHNAPLPFVETMRQPRPIVPGNAHYRLLHGEDIVHIEDVTAEDIYRAGNPARRALADLAFKPFLTKLPPLPWSDRGSV